LTLLRKAFLMKFNSSHVVIDADVARSAGGAEHPVSKTARNLLQGIAESGLPVAFCPVLLAEWRKHRSQLSARWLSSMIARKKFHYLKPTANTQSEIEKCALSEKDRAVAEKDAHVVDIAIATGNFIASNDKVARGVFSVVAQNTTLLDGLIWAVPVDSSDVLVNIFNNGGLVPKQWLIRVD
jgi:predicted nucleic acid-binding protein